MGISFWQRATALPLIFFTFSVIFKAESVPPSQQRYYYEDPNSTALRETRDSVDQLRHQVNNHESEIHTFEEKLKNLDTIIESLRDDFGETHKAQKELVKGSSASLESKIAALEATTKGMTADLKQFKTHANETSTALTQYKQKMVEMEKVLDQQSQNIEHLQAALNTLMEVIQGKDPSSSKTAIAGADGMRSYRVKSGDSLEKIAKAHQTTVQAIKELNHLSNDKIVVGKTLQIP